MTTSATILEDTCSYLQSLLATVPGMRSAPDVITDSANVWPFGVTICRDAEFEIGDPQGAMLMLATFATQIHVSRRDAARDFLSAMPLLLAYVKLLEADVTLGGKVSTIVKRGTGSAIVTGKFAAMKYAADATVGWDVEIPVKVIIS